MSCLSPCVRDVGTGSLGGWEMARGKEKGIPRLSRAGREDGAGGGRVLVVVLLMSVVLVVEVDVIVFSS